MLSRKNKEIFLGLIEKKNPSLYKKDNYIKMIGDVMFKAVRVVCLVMFLVVIAYGVFLLNRQSITPMGALERLERGNERFVEGKSLYTQTKADPFAEPFAILVCCSSCCSKHTAASPDTIFDQPKGELAIFQVKGNALDQATLKKIEFLVEKENVPLIFVLGHEDCAVVGSTLSGKSAKQKVKNSGHSLEGAIKTNLEFTTKKLEEEPLFKNLIQEGKLMIRSGYYGIDHKKVEVLPRSNS